MKSALFVDFDNVYTQLRAVNPVAAERFARHPVDWLRWLTEDLEIPSGHDPAARRRVLVRRCYLNPNWYRDYRSAFLRAGFEIVDCPPVTSQGKTSTDIHMVLDSIELLQHETRYDEFIVLSADADFTPVLRKLRRHDRRTTVLAVGFPSAAYQASADLMIDERQFMALALGLGDKPATDEAPGLPAPAPSKPTVRRSEPPPSQAATAPATEPAASLPATDPWAGHEAVLPLAREVSQLTGAPLLAPPVVAAVLDALCADLARHSYEPTETARRVCAACQAQKPAVEVALRDVVFLLRGMQLNGHVFGRGMDDVPTLSQRLLNQMLFLCQREQLPLGPDELQAMRQWLVGAPPGTGIA